MILDLPNLNAFGLVDTAFVRVCRHMNADDVMKLVESGDLLYVFNVSIRERSSVRELRYFLTEVVAKQMTARMSIEEVLEKIFPPTRNFFWAGEVAKLLLLSRQATWALAKKLGAVLVKNSHRFTRASLVAFLRERWIGGKA